LDRTGRSSFYKKYFGVIYENISTKFVIKNVVLLPRIYRTYTKIHPRKTYFIIIIFHTKSFISNLKNFKHFNKKFILLNPSILKYLFIIKTTLKNKKKWFSIRDSCFFKKTFIKLYRSF
jgi:hypothetical protein